MIRIVEVQLIIGIDSPPVWLVLYWSLSFSAVVCYYSMYSEVLSSKV